jgi:pantoate--beta-alanine ligase
MRIAHTIAELRAILTAALPPVAVPTMGGLHRGHISLIRIAKSRGRPVVATIFVNRLQFAPTDDFDRYPRTPSRDIELLEAEGCDVLFAPSESEMYPEPQGCFVQPPPELAGMLEGRFRPAFFSGVCTVVLKLFNIVQPEFAVFGKKDYQQLLVIRNMVRQLALPIEVIGGETIRESDGLALSSRNAYLDSAERAEAPHLQATLRLTGEAIRSGRRDWHGLEQEAVEALGKRGWVPNYVAIRRRDDLLEPTTGAALVVLGAAVLGTTRLIDNLEIDS